MSEQTERQLRIAVERIVRPLRAGYKRKLQMREELLSHLTAVFEEERARGKDEASAVAQAVARFGDPATLRREYQTSLPWYERYLMSGFDPNRSPAWHARQLAPGLAVAHLVTFLLIGGILWKLGPNQRGAAESSWLLGLAFLMTGSALACGAGLWGLLQFCGALYGTFGVRRSPRQAVGLALALLVLTEATLTAFFAFAARVPLADWLASPVVYRFALFPVLPVAVLMGLTYPLTAYFIRLELQQLQAWHQLALDEA